MEITEVVTSGLFGRSYRGKMYTLPFPKKGVLVFVQGIHRSESFIIDKVNFNRKKQPSSFEAKKIISYDKRVGTAVSRIVPLKKLLAKPRFSGGRGRWGDANNSFNELVFDYYEGPGCWF